MKKYNILIITFEGLLSPVFWSQFVPLMRKLAKEFNFSVITVERHSIVANKRIACIRNELQKEGIRCYSLPLQILPLKLSLPINILLASLVTLFFILNKKIDILHIRRYDAIVTALLVKKFLKRKVIFDPRGLFIEERIEEGEWHENDIRFRLYRSLEHTILKNADKIITVSKPLKKYLQQCMKKVARNITLVPNCVDLTRFQAVTPQQYKRVQKKATTLVYIGGTSHWHMIDEMIRFFLVLRQYRKSFFLFITYDNHDAIKEKFIKNGLTSDDFAVRSALPEQIPEYLSCADAGMALTEPSLATLVCAPIKFGEYLAAGLPVVINPGIGETEKIIKMHRVGIIYTAGRINESLNELVKLLDDKSIRKRCRSVAEKLFSLDIAAQRLDDVYRETFTES